MINPLKSDTKMESQLLNQEQFLSKSTQLSYIKPILVVSTVLLVVFRLLTLFDSTKGLHGFDLFTKDLLTLAYALVGLLIVVYFVVGFKTSSSVDSTVLVVVLVQGGLLVLEVLTNSTELASAITQNYNTILGLGSVLTLSTLMFLTYLQQNQKYTINSILFLLVFVVLFLVVLSNLLSSDSETRNTLIFSADIVMWGVLLIASGVLAVRFYEEKGTLVWLPLLLGAFFGFGMGFGMSRRDLTKAIIATIYDQSFGLAVINETLAGFLNPEFITILLSGLTALTLVFLVLFSYIYRRGDWVWTTAFLILALTGLSVDPFVAWVRIIGLVSVYYYLSTTDTNNVISAPEGTIPASSHPQQPST